MFEIDMKTHRPTRQFGVFLVGKVQISVVLLVLPPTDILSGNCIAFIVQTTKRTMSHRICIARAHTVRRVYKNDNTYSANIHDIRPHKGLAYSKVNGHIYATCSGVGMMEMNPSQNYFDVVTKHKVCVTEVHRAQERVVIYGNSCILGYSNLIFQGATGGQVYSSPDEKHIVSVGVSCAVEGSPS